jgi:hypothetical protein
MSQWNARLKAERSEATQCDEKSALNFLYANGLVEALFASVRPSELPVLETYGNFSETNEYAKPCKKRP